VWQPQGQADAFAKSYQLYVWWPATTGNREFEDQITKLTHVLSVGTPAMTVQGIPGMPAAAPGDYVCSAVLGALPAGTAGIWDNSDNWYTSSVTFAAPLNSYDAALYAISNLGLGLDGACYTSAPAGQEQTFATTHTLKVQTTIDLTSTTWRQQLSATPGVVSVASPTDHKAC